MKKYEEARKILCQHLAQVAKDKSISQEHIAVKTGWTQSNVSRMLAGKYSPSLDNFLKLAEAVGCYFFIEDKLKEGDSHVEFMKNRWGKIEKN